VNSSDSVGVSVGGIFADYMVEVRGIGGRITSQTPFRWQPGWVSDPSLTLRTAKNASALEGSLGLSPAELNAPLMVFETNDWSNRGDTTVILVTRGSAPPAPKRDGQLYGADPWMAGTRGAEDPVVLDVSGNGVFWFRDTNHATETECTFNKVAKSTKGPGPAKTISLSTGQTACWYVDETTGQTIPTGSWETLLDVTVSSAEYDVRFQIWNKNTDTIAETIGACNDVTTQGDDVQCLITSVAQKSITSDQVVRVVIAHSFASGTISIDYDDGDSSGDSRTTLPIPEFRDLLIPATFVVVVFVVIRRRSQRRT